MLLRASCLFQRNQPLLKNLQNNLSLNAPSSFLSIPTEIFSAEAIEAFEFGLNAPSSFLSIPT